MKALRVSFVVALVALMSVSSWASNTTPAPTGGTAVVKGVASQVDAGASKFTLTFTARDGKTATTAVTWTSSTNMTAPPTEGQKVAVSYNNVSSARSRTGVPASITAERIAQAD